MRRAARTDANHSEIVAALRKVGAFVTSLAAVGDGCPDILVCFRNRLIAVEIKDGSNGLTPDQVRWHAQALRHGVHVLVVRSVDDALRGVGVIA